MIVAILFACGIIAGHADYIEQRHTFSLFAVALAVALSLVVLLRHRWRHARWRISMALAMVAAVCAGWAANLGAWKSIEGDWAKIATHKSSSFIGTVNSVKHGQNVMTMNLSLDTGPRIYLAVPSHLIHEHPHVGETLVFNARLRSLLPCHRGDGTSNYERYLLHNGVVAQGYARMARLLHTQPASVPQRMRKALLSRLGQSGLGDRQEALAAALLTADRSRISKRTNEAFRDAGAAHVLALSGMHLGLFTWLLFALMGRHVRDRRRNAVVVLVAVWTFVLMAAAPLSLVRAALLVSGMMCACLMRYRVCLFDALWGALLVILVIQPHALYDAGAQLSFASVFGLAIMDWHLCDRKSSRHAQKMLLAATDDNKSAIDKATVWSARCIQALGKWLAGMFVASVVCTLSALPVTMLQFGRVYAYSAVSSIVLVPMTMVTLSACVVLLLFPFPWLASAVSTFMECEIEVAQWFARLPGAGGVIAGW